MAQGSQDKKTKTDKRQEIRYDKFRTSRSLRFLGVIAVFDLTEKIARVAQGSQDKRQKQTIDKRQ